MVQRWETNWPRLKKLILMNNRSPKTHQIQLRATWIAVSLHPNCPVNELLVSSVSSLSLINWIKLQVGKHPKIKPEDFLGSFSLSSLSVWLSFQGCPPVSWGQLWITLSQRCEDQSEACQLSRYLQYRSLSLSFSLSLLYLLISLSVSLSLSSYQITSCITIIIIAVSHP